LRSGASFKLKFTIISRAKTIIEVNLKAKGIIFFYKKTIPKLEFQTLIIERRNTNI
jgi:hypothetical protein